MGPQGSSCCSSPHSDALTSLPTATRPHHQRPRPHQACLGKQAQHLAPRNRRLMARTKPSKPPWRQRGGVTIHDRTITAVGQQHTSSLPHHLSSAPTQSHNSFSFFLYSTSGPGLMGTTAADASPGDARATTSGGQPRACVYSGTSSKARRAAETSALIHLQVQDNVYRLHKSTNWAKPTDTLPRPRSATAGTTCVRTIARAGTVVWSSFGGVMVYRCVP